jgi:hypothetical protein
LGLFLPISEYFSNRKNNQKQKKVVPSKARGRGNTAQMPKIALKQKFKGVTAIPSPNYAGSLKYA